MTSSGQPEMNMRERLRESDVVAFLAENPTFLDRHPELLGSLSIPHASGDAVSLLERQVTVLREDNARLKRQLDELVLFARNNESLNGRIHKLALALVNAAGPRAIFECLDSCLREDFAADHVVVRVFAEPAFIESDGMAQFSGADSSGRSAFEAVLGSGGAVCGALSDAQKQVLFDAEVDAASAVIMPLIGKQWDGVLVIASNEPERFEAGMGTEFLTYLKDVVALVVDPWVKRPRAD